MTRGRRSDAKCLPYDSEPPITLRVSGMTFRGRLESVSAIMNRHREVGRIASDADEAIQGFTYGPGLLRSARNDALIWLEQTLNLRQFPRLGACPRQCPHPRF